MGAGSSMKDSKGRQLISQPALEISYDLSVSSDFDGKATTQIYTDAAGTIPLLEYGVKPVSISSKFGSGFVFRPATAGDYAVLSYEAYRINGCEIDDTLQHTMYSLPAGAYAETRVIKVYETGSDGTLIDIGV